jgi:hypothetical protein
VKVNRFLLEQTAYIAGRLNAIQEGERTLLDNTMLLHLSSMRSGDHTTENLPVVMVGGGGGRIKGGRVHDYIKQPNRQICRLYMSMMDKMGVRVDSFGDAREALQEI